MLEGIAASAAGVFTEATAQLNIEYTAEHEPN